MRHCVSLAAGKSCKAAYVHGLLAQGRGHERLSALIIDNIAMTSESQVCTAVYDPVDCQHVHKEEQVHIANGHQTKVFE